jgi:hypothetical protein
MYWNYVSCLLTIISTLLVGKRLWHGWMLAGLNSVIICFIGFQTRQWGFIPANLFCLAIYAHNIRKWRVPETVEMESTAVAAVARVNVERQAIPQNAYFSEGEKPSRGRTGRFRRRATYGDFRKIKIRLTDGIDRNARHDFKRSDF